MKFWKINFDSQFQLQVVLAFSLITLGLLLPIKAQDDCKIISFSDSWRYIKNVITSFVTTNSMHDVDINMWKETKAEFLFETQDGLISSWTNVVSPTNSSDYVGTSTIISNTAQYLNVIYTNANGMFTNGFNYYDGVNKYTTEEIKADGYYATNAFTIMGWYNVETSAVSTTFLYGYTNLVSASSYLWIFFNDLGTTNSQLAARFGLTGFITSGKGIIQTNKWVHYALTYNSGLAGVTKAKLYTNGYEMALTSSGNVSGVMINRLMLGTRVDLANDYKGYIDSFSFVNGTNFSQSQILSNYNATAYRFNAFPLLGTNSMRDVDINMWQETKAEYLFEKPNMLSFTNIDITNSSDYVGTSTLISNQYTYIETSSNGYLNGCAYFDGNDDFATDEIKSDGYYNTNTWTIQGWVYYISNSAPTICSLVHAGTNTLGNNSLYIGLNQTFDSTVCLKGSINVVFGSTSGTQIGGCSSTGTLPPTNAWTHIAVTYNNTLPSAIAMAIYTNGALLPLAKTNNSTGCHISRMMYGNRTDKALDYKGYMDGWSYSSTNFSQSQIQSNYNATKYRYGL